MTNKVVITSKNTHDLDEIWQAYQQQLRHFLYTKLNNEADIDDVMQEVFVKTYQHLPSLHSHSSIKAWLFQITKNTLIDFYRQRAKHEKIQQIAISELWLDETSRCVKQEMTPCLAPFIQSLSSQSAALLTAIELEGQSQKQLAEQLGISYSTLKSRVQKSRLELKQRFEHCCYFEYDVRGELMNVEQKIKNKNYPKC